MSTDPVTLSKAVLRAADHLGLRDALPAILSLDEQTVIRMARGEYALDPTRSEWEAGTRFAGLFRSLLTLVGNAAEARAWLETPHGTLGAPPAQLLRTADGRDRVFKYLDAVQKFEIKLPPRGMRH